MKKIFAVLTVIVTSTVMPETGFADCSTDWHSCKTTGSLINENKEMDLKIKTACVLAAERQQNQAIDWGGVALVKFGAYIPMDMATADGKVTLVDKSAKYENIYGAKLKTETACVYDLKSMTVSEIYTRQASPR